MDKSNKINILDDKTLLEEKANLETKEEITSDIKLDDIFYNFLNNIENKIPKINDRENLLIYLEYFFNKYKEDNSSPDEVLLRKKQFLILLVGQLIDNIEDMTEKVFQEKMEQYFYDKKFFDIFFEILIKKDDISVFKQKIIFVSKVSLKYINTIPFIIIDDSKCFKR